MTPAEPLETGDVLHFWFDELSNEQHFKRDDDIDRVIKQRFGGLHATLAAHVSDPWRATPRAMLAAIIVLDQFSRNIYRDESRAFAQDAAALALANEAVARGFDRDLTHDERQFAYMPLMHSELLADVERCIALMQSAGHAEGEAFARKHAATIARFGRYPARNAALGRESTLEELRFLKDNPAGF